MDLGSSWDTLVMSYCHNGAIYPDTRDCDPWHWAPYLICLGGFPGEPTQLICSCSPGSWVLRGQHEGRHSEVWDEAGRQLCVLSGSPWSGHHTPRQTRRGELGQGWALAEGVHVQWVSWTNHPPHIHCLAHARHICALSGHGRGQG
jgi:hypothetical protein